jgi:hypothetical protein
MNIDLHCGTLFFYNLPLAFKAFMLAFAFGILFSVGGKRRRRWIPWSSQRMTVFFGEDDSIFWGG